MPVCVDILTLPKPFALFRAAAEGVSSDVNFWACFPSELPLWRDGKELPDVEAENCGRVGAKPCRGRVIGAGVGGGCCTGGPGPFKTVMALVTVL